MILNSNNNLRKVENTVTGTTSYFIPHIKNRDVEYIESLPPF